MLHRLRCNLSLVIPVMGTGLPPAEGELQVVVKPHWSDRHISPTSTTEAIPSNLYLVDLQRSDPDK